MSDSQPERAGFRRRRDGKDPRVVRDMFSSISVTYDLLNHLLSLNMDRVWRRRAVSASAVGTGHRVLDVCAGTGDLGLAFSRVVGPGGRVVFADFSLEMLRIASRKSQRDGKAPSMFFLSADTTAIPFPDRYFDAVSVGFGIRNIQNMALALREMARVTRPEGRIVVLEFTRPRRGLATAIQKLYVNRVVPWIGDAISGSRAKPYAYLARTMASFLDRDEMTAQLQQAGLLDVRVEMMNFGLVALHVATAGG